MENPLHFQVNTIMKTFNALEGCRSPPFDYIGLLTSKLNSQRKEGKHCDVTLIHGKQSFPVHVAILCAASDYFSSLLDGSFREGQQKNIDVTASFPNIETLETLLQYMYTGDLDINRNNVEDLLEGAHFIMLEQAVKLIAQYLADSLVLENCIEIFMLSSRFDIKELVDLSTRIINARLHDFLFDNDKEKFYALPPDLIRNISQGFSHLTAEEIISFLKNYLLDLLHEQEEHSKELLLSFKSMLVSIKEDSLNINRNHVSKFCASLVDILSDESIKINPQSVSEKLCSSLKGMSLGSDEQSLCPHVALKNEKDDTEGKRENNSKIGKHKDSMDFEEIILIRTEEFPLGITRRRTGLTKFSFYAYLTTANKWVEISEIGEKYKYDRGAEHLEDMRFIGFSEGHMLFTAISKIKEESNHVFAFGILPGMKDSCLTSWSTHICHLHQFVSEQGRYPSCSHHIFASTDNVFCIYPTVCCNAAVRLEDEHTAEIAGYNVEVMDWLDHNDEEFPIWNDVGTLELPSSFRSNFPFDSHHNEAGNFSQVFFFTQETSSCTYIMACSRVCKGNVDHESQSVFAVFKMSPVSDKDRYSFEIIRSGTLGKCLYLDSCLQVAGTEQYLMLYRADRWNFDSWKIELNNICVEDRLSSHIHPTSLSLELIKQNDYDWLPEILTHKDDMPQVGGIQIVASTNSGHFYGFENFGPLVTCLTRVTDFECESKMSTNNSDELTAADGRWWYAKKKTYLPAPPIDQVITEVAIAVVPNRLIKHLRERPRAQFKNTRANASTGPYYHEDYEVIDTYVYNEDSRFRRLSRRPSDSD